MLHYEITVQGATKDGHPINFMTNLFKLACSEMEKLKEKYPYNDVRLFECTRREIKIIYGNQKPIPTKCPSGHELRLIDGKSSIVETLKDTYQCKICGELFRRAL